MIVSRIKPHEDQAKLWPWVGDRTFTSVAEMRTYCGDFYEECARLLFYAERHQTDGRADICPDLSIAGHHFLEVKSLRYGSQGIVYAHSLKRQRALVRSGGKLSYLFFCHHYKAGMAKTLAELQSGLASYLDCVIAIPFAELMPAVAKLEPAILNYRTGGKPMHGYRIPWSLLRELSDGQMRALWGCRPYDYDVPSVPMWGKL